MLGMEEMENEGGARYSYIRLFRYRFVVLAIFFMNSAMNAFASMQYIAITEATESYYEVTVMAVNWTTLIFAVTCAILQFAGMWFLNKIGLKPAIIACAVLNCLGSGIKVASVNPDRFYLVLIGQSIISIGQIFIFPVPPLVAGDWFGAGEVSKACAVGVLSYQFGAAFSSLVPTLILGASKERCETEPKLLNMQYGYFALSLLILLLTVIGMKSKPKTPPSYAAAMKEGLRNVQPGFTMAIKRLMINKNFLLHSFAFGFNIAVMYTLGRIFSQLCLMYFPDNLQDIGWFGMLLIFVGIPSSFIVGYLLDKTKRYKGAALITYGSSIVAVFLLGVMLHLVTNIHWIVIPAIASGFSFAAYLTSGYELGAEMTYPELESTMAGVLYTFVQVFALILLPVSTQISLLFFKNRDLVYLSIFVIILTVGIILTALTKPDYRRRNMEENQEIQQHLLLGYE